jgi:hypothetical protein
MCVHAWVSEHIAMCCEHLGKCAVMKWKCATLSYICVYMDVYVLRPESMCDYDAREPRRI